jgi:hypothetical protein
VNLPQTSNTSPSHFSPLFDSALSLPAKSFIFAGVLFFTLSLLLTSLFTSSDDIQGIWILLIGWMGLIIFQLSWFANPLNLLALLLVSKRPTLALLLSILAVFLASQTLSLSEIPIGLNNEKIHIKEMGLGFYFWYLSQGLFLTGIAIEAFKQAQKNGD